jgi:hypothetical protein
VSERTLDASPVIVVLLRRPRGDAAESRDDPFWEFGSFGCTGCHSKNLLNRRGSDELKGAHLAFVQGGDGGFRLVHVTSPVLVQDVADNYEAVWTPAEMPLTYAAAPIVLNNQGYSDIPLLAALVNGVIRSTPEGKFSSAFRSRREALPKDIAAQVLATYLQFRERGAEVATHYVQAMPYPPPRIERDRAARYESIRSRWEVTDSRAAESDGRKHRHC